jgi:hypothetical protein
MFNMLRHDAALKPRRMRLTEALAKATTGILMGPKVYPWESMILGKKVMTLGFFHGKKLVLNCDHVIKRLNDYYDTRTHCRHGFYDPETDFDKQRFGNHC